MIYGRTWISPGWSRHGMMPCRFGKMLSVCLILAWSICSPVRKWNGCSGPWLGTCMTWQWPRNMPRTSWRKSPRCCRINISVISRYSSLCLIHGQSTRYSRLYRFLVWTSSRLNRQQFRILPVILTGRLIILSRRVISRTIFRYTSWIIRNRII